MRLPTEKMKKIQRTGIRKIFDRATAYENEGRKIYHMEIGRPDFDTPDAVKEAAIRSLKAGNVHYTSNYGLESLREAIAGKLVSENKIDADPERELIVTAGAVEALALSTMALLEPEDEVLVPNPCFTSYENQVIHPCGVPVPVPLRAENGFMPALEDLEARLTAKTRMLIINTPHNPTGVVYSRKVMEQLASFAVNNDLLVVSDECYEKIIFDREHVSMASLPGMKERTITVNSGSKTFSMTGWRVGFVHSSAEIIDYMLRVHQDLVICPTAFAQEGAAYAWKNTAALAAPMVEAFKQRRDLVIEHLDQIKNLDYVRPEGGFYVFPSIGKLGLGDWEFCHYLLDEAGVAVVPGLAFGQFGEGCFRLAYSCSMEDLKDGLGAMKKALEKL